MEMTVPFLPVPMIVLVWEHVILQQEHAHAMLDVTEMTALQFVQAFLTVALVWEHLSMIHPLIQLHVTAWKVAMDWIVLLYVQMIALVWEHVIHPQEPAHAMKDAMEMTALLFALMTALVWEPVLFQHQ